MKEKIFTLIYILIISFAQAQDYTSYVNPFIGSDNYGATNPGAVAPRGMVSVVPFNVAVSPNKHIKDKGWWSTPYSNANQTLSGFSHVNLSGVGCPDLGTIILMPTTGELQTSPRDYSSDYSNEVASPGYYSNYLNRYNIKTEQTASLRTGVSKYTFPRGKANILLDLGVGLSNEQDSYLRIVSNDQVEGFRTVGSFCYNNPEEIYPVYFVVKFSEKSNDFGAWKKSPKITGDEANWVLNNGATRILKNYMKPLVGDSIGAFFRFDIEEAKTIEVRVAISYVSIENARENLKIESENKSFEQLKSEVKENWRKRLSVIEVEGGTEDQKTIFYTALYHTLIHPNILNDCNGEHPTVGSSKISKTDGQRYTVFSLWDTYRNMHQLTCLLFPGEQLHMINSMLSMYKENGWLPKWELNATETFTMVGDPAAIVIADTYLRGLRDFDINLALEAVLKSANTLENNPIRPELKDYLKYKYIPVQKEYDASVSTSLEYNVADFAIAQLAESMGRKDISKLFTQRSKYYQNMYDKNLGVMRPRLKNGDWYEPFSPMDGANFAPVTGFMEGTSWHYSFMVAHDAPGLIRLNGGNKKFIEKLQWVFDNDLYEPDNEPDMGYAFLFNYVKGEEWRSQKEVRKIVDQYYSNSPGGIPGNDDTGTMSAWLVFAMMGIYPDAPARPHYTITAPYFDNIKIHLNTTYYNGKVFEIEVVKRKSDASVIEKIELNGKRLNSYFINHSDVVNGSILKIYLK